MGDEEMVSAARFVRCWLRNIFPPSLLHLSLWVDVAGETPIIILAVSRLSYSSFFFWLGVLTLALLLYELASRTTYTCLSIASSMRMSHH